MNGRADSARGKELGLEQFGAAPDDAGVSLDELSRAYAELLARGDDPYQAAPSKATLPSEAADAAELLAADVLDDSEQADDAADGAEEEADACPISPRSILEAMLFVGHPQNEPLQSQQVAALMRGVRAAEIDELVQELIAEYDQQRCPYTIRSVGAGYRLELRREFFPLRDKFFGRVKAARLTQSAVDVLAIVAYNQPLSRERVDELRGRPSGGVLAQLVRRQLLQLERTTVDGKKSAVYRTTPRFLELFGLSSIDELPQASDA